MFNNLSKSVAIMFFFDVFILLLSTSYWYKFFGLNEKYFLLAACLTIAAGLITLFLKDNYKIREFNITFKNAYLLFEGCLFASFPAAALLFFYKANNAGCYVLVNLFTIWVLLLLYRIVFHYYLFRIKRTKRVLIVGSGEKVHVIQDIIKNKYALKMEVVSVYDDKKILSDNLNLNSNSNNITSGRLDFANGIYNDILAQAAKDKADIIIFSSFGNLNSEFSLACIYAFAYSRPRNIKFYSLYDFYEMSLRKCYIDDFSAQKLQEKFMHNKFLVYRFCKRVYDIIAASIILTLTFPILLYIGIRVKLTDGGSIIYTQNRVGRSGKVFKAYKIRTMYANDYKPDENNLSKADNQNTDDRVIPFCHWVRKARFDEIPQMVNILKGEMSIVGPRAEWEDVVKVYEKEIPYHYMRNLVKTGWTGWAQINQGHLFSSDLEAEKLQYDFYYIKNRNILWEIGILIKAVFLALGGRHD